MADISGGLRFLEADVESTIFIQRGLPRGQEKKPDSQGLQVLTVGDALSFYRFLSSMKN